MGEPPVSRNGQGLKSHVIQTDSVHVRHCSNACSAKSPRRNLVQRITLPPSMNEIRPRPYGVDGQSTFQNPASANRLD
jgi:hypothetical protein